MSHIDADDHSVPIVQKSQLLWKKLIDTATFEVELERNVRVILGTFVELFGKNTDRVDSKFDVAPKFHA